MSVTRVKISRYIRGKTSPVLVKTLIAITNKMSRSALLTLGNKLGVLLYFLSGSHRRRSIDNLSIVFGDRKTPDEKKRIAKAAFQNFAKSGIEMLMVNSKPESFLKEQVVIEGGEHLDRALARGKGVVGLSAHFGNFIILHGRLGVEGHKVNCVVKALRDEGVEKIVQGMRTAWGMNTIYVSPNTQCIKSCREALVSNEILILLNDQPHKHGIQVEFFGTPVWTAAGPASLALTTDAAVVPMFMIRNPDDTHRLIISEQIPLIRTEDRKQDIITNTLAFTKITESYVLRHPEQWAWNQRRWRKQVK